MLCFDLVRACMMIRASTPCSVLRTMGGAWRHMDLSPFTIKAPFPSCTSPSLSNALPAYLHALTLELCGVWIVF